MTSPLAQSLPLPHSLLPALDSIPLLLLMPILSSGALSLDSPCDICFHIPKNFLHCYCCFMQQTFLLDFWCTRRGGVSEHTLITTLEKDSLERCFLTLAKPFSPLCSLTLCYWDLNELTIRAQMFSEHWIFWLGVSYQNTIKVSVRCLLYSILWKCHKVVIFSICKLTQKYRCLSLFKRDCREGSDIQ